MARNTNLNVAPGGGGGAQGRSLGKIKVSSNVTVKPKNSTRVTDAKETARLKAINAPKTDPNAGRAKAATKAANKDVVSKPMPKTSKLFGKKVVGQPKQVSKAKAAKIKASEAKTTAKADAKKKQAEVDFNTFVNQMTAYSNKLNKFNK
jgi:hypothetical protein